MKTKLSIYLLLIMSLCSLLLGNSYAATFVFNNTNAGVINAGISCAGANRLVRTFNVNTHFTINDVNLGFNASHTWRGDISLQLQFQPPGLAAATTVQVLTTNTGGGGRENNWDLELDDESPNAPPDDNNNDNVNAPNYNLDRTSRPNNALTPFDTQDAFGTWSLIMCDAFPAADNGTFNIARLTFDGDAVNDADINITKTDSSLTYEPGTTATYVITVTNSGTDSVNSVTVSDTLPAGVTLTAPVTCASNGTASCGAASFGVIGGNSFTDTAALVTPGAANSVVYTVNVQFDSDPNNY